LLYTDYYIIISTDATNRYQELKKFAKSIKLDPESLCNHEGLLYYPVWHREGMQQMSRKGIFYISRKRMLDHFKGGKYLFRRKVKYDYGYYNKKRFLEKRLEEIAEHYGIKIPYRNTETIYLQNRWTYSFYQDPDENRINIRIDQDNPDGIAWTYYDGVARQIDIPPDVQQKIIDARRPLSHFLTHLNY
jgi:hypothetical protein